MLYNSVKPSLSYRLRISKYIHLDYNQQDKDNDSV